MSERRGKGSEEEKYRTPGILPEHLLFPEDSSLKESAAFHDPLNEKFSDMLKVSHNPVTDTRNA